MPLDLSVIDVYKRQAGACAADPAEARAEDVASDRSAAGNAPEGEEAHRDEQP